MMHLATADPGLKMPRWKSRTLRTRRWRRDLARSFRMCCLDPYNSSREKWQVLSR